MLLIFSVFVVAVFFLTFVLCYRVWLSCLRTLVLLLQKLYLALQSFDFEHTWRKLFQKFVRTRFDIYVLFSRFRIRLVFCLLNVASDPELSILARLSLSVFSNLYFHCNFIPLFSLEFPCSRDFVVNRINKNPEKET